MVPGEVFAGCCRVSGGSGVAVGVVVVAEIGGGCHYDGLHEELRQPVANVIKNLFDDDRNAK